jgi:hypothetical protein
MDEFAMGGDDRRDCPDSHRNVKNVDFGNQAAQPLDGDFDRSGVVDGADYIVWRRTLGTSVSPFGGADGDGDGVIDTDDYGVWRNNFGRYIDDHGNSSPVATAISAVPSTNGGVIDVPGDVDWFSFTASAGSTYDLATTLGTLPDSVLRLIDSDGVTELDQNDNDVGLESLITWTAPADGIYFAEVRSFDTQIGSYDFSVSLSGSDDHGNNAGVATAFTVPSTKAGEIEVLFDVDWFRFNAVSGTSYEFDTVLGTLSDSVLRLIAPNGTTELAYDDDGGSGFASHIDWTASSSGTYYIEVSGYGSDFGTYDLTSIAAGAGSGSSLSLASAALASAPAASSGLIPAGPLHFEAAGSLASSPEADAQGAAAVLDFAAFRSGLPVASGHTIGAQFAAGTTNNAARSDAALVAWMESFADRKVDLAFNEKGEGAGEIYGENGGDGLFNSIDSIFDQLGAAAFAAGCAV